MKKNHLILCCNLRLCESQGMKNKNNDSKIKFVKPSKKTSIVGAVQFFFYFKKIYFSFKYKFYCIIYGLKSVCSFKVIFLLRINSSVNCLQYVFVCLPICICVYFDVLVVENSMNCFVLIFIFFCLKVFLYIS